MSTTKKRNLHNRRAGGGEGHRPKPLKDHTLPSERSDQCAGDLVLSASQEFFKALWEGREQEAGISTVVKWHVQLIKDEEEVEEIQDEKDENLDENEEDGGDSEWEEEENELENEEYDVELEKEDEKDRDDDMEEKESGDSEEEEEEVKKEVLNLSQVSIVQFRSLVWDLVNSSCCQFSFNDHDLAQPSEINEISHHSQQPVPRESVDPSKKQKNLRKKRVPQEQEDLKKKSRIGKGRGLAEGTSWMKQEPTERAIYQKAGKKVTEAGTQECKLLTDACKSWKARAHAYDGAETSACGKWLPSRHILAAPGGRSYSKKKRAQKFPLVVKKRVNALKNLQAQYAKLEAQFYEDLYDLEKIYAAFYQPIFHRRSEIINAVYEPTEDECHWKGDVGGKICPVRENEPEGKEQIAGIPHFWLKTFKNAKILARMITEEDEPILEHLKDVEIKFPKYGLLNFSIEFIFEPNEYFFNQILRKSYQMKTGPDHLDPFFSKGPEIISSRGCEIYWKNGKDITMRSVTVQKYGSHSSESTTMMVRSESFFNYFNSYRTLEEKILNADNDYKLGYFFREVLIPKSVLFYIKEVHKISKYESSDDEAEEAGGEEEKKAGIRNEEPEKDLNQEDGSF